MTIVVEDGTGSDPTANSYVTVQELRDFAGSVGYSNLPVDDIELEPLLINAMYVIEAKCYQGNRSFADQPLSFPRTGLTHDGVSYPSNEIPVWLKNAQCSYALTSNDTALFISDSGGTYPVKEERVEGAITIKYDTSKGGVSQTTSDSRAESLLEPFYCYGSGGVFAFGVRA